MNIQYAPGQSRMPAVPMALPITMGSGWRLPPMVQALQDYRNPWGNARGITTDSWGNPIGSTYDAVPKAPSELEQWVQMTATQGSPMERYLKWRDIYKPNNQGWADKFQAEREREAAIKSGLINTWGGLSGQRAQAGAQVGAANAAANAAMNVARINAETQLKLAGLAPDTGSVTSGVKK